jgi:hypothetical protein
MYDYEMVQDVARQRRESYERQAEVYRMLREARESGGNEGRVSLARRALYGLGQGLVRLGNSLQRPYCDTLEIGA